MVKGSDAYGDILRGLEDLIASEMVLGKSHLFRFEKDEGFVFISTTRGELEAALNLVAVPIKGRLLYRALMSDVIRYLETNHCVECGGSPGDNVPKSAVYAVQLNMLKSLNREGNLFERLRAEAKEKAKEEADKRLEAAVKGGGEE